MAHTSLSIFMLTLTLATLSQIVKQVSGATLTIANNCSETVWPAIYSNNQAESASVLPISGFTLQRGQSFSLDAPSGWNGRIWGRTLCSTDQSRNFTCVTGECGSGKLECAGGTDVPPSTTRAEFSVGSFDGRDFYDVTLVDGFNLPMLVAPQQVGGTSSSNCSSAGCLSDVNTVCPPELVVTRSTSGGGVVACKGACGALNEDQYCCSGSNRSTCGPTSYSRLFKTACPNAYSYPLDDINTTFVCAAADYVVTFCPSLSNTRSNGSGTVSQSSPNCTSYNCTGNGCTPQPGSGTLSLPLKIGIGIGAALIGILFVCSILYYRTRKSSSSALVAIWKRNTENDEKVEAFILQYGASTPKRYRYADIKKMTNSFKDQLGQGGYGSVFKGRLTDGRLVAVKLLNASKGNGEEFVNEVASMGRTSHVNIVSLLGFCYEGRKGALIYEFMPNGSLDKFIYSNNPLEAGQHIGVEKLYDIALGIARGLDYLHRGCNTPILHLDIKPQNILLDEEFCPKIADFGLAKLYNKKKSNVSMLEARGTIGYIAPEVFNRNLAGVSDKSDVYSYGMMMIEIVGERNNNNAEAIRSSEIYFPNWIYKRLELDEGLQLQGPMTRMENEIARKMMLVGLWCIQTDPSQRPAINKVIDMLEGCMDALEVPPKPFFSSLQPTTNASSTFSV